MEPRRWKIIQRDGVDYPTASPVALDDPEGEFDSETDTYRAIYKQTRIRLDELEKNYSAAVAESDRLRQETHAARDAHAHVTRLLDLCRKAGS